MDREDKNPDHDASLIIGDSEIDSLHEDSSGLSIDIAIPKDISTGDVATSDLLDRDISASDISERGGIVTARGTGNGLVIRLDGRVDKKSLKEATLEFLATRKGFITGNDVALEWVGVMPDQSFVDELSELLTSEFEISVRSSDLWEAPRRPAASEGYKSESYRLENQNDAAVEKRIAGEQDRSKRQKIADRIRGASGMEVVRGDAGKRRSPSLFDGIEDLSSTPYSTDTRENDFESDSSEYRSGSRRSSVREVAPASLNKPINRQAGSNLAIDSAAWDDPDARIVYATLRSGQKVETEHSLVVFGDVNSGAELVAGGDIIVLGTLRGIAHAGAYDETGGGRVIIALNLQPTQLRIGMTISRGLSENSSRSGETDACPEIARVEGNLIVVEPYSARTGLGRRR